MEMREILEKVIAKENLSLSEAQKAMLTVMEGKATPVQIGGFLTALRTKGETKEEIAGFAQAMREVSRPIKLDLPLVADTCGTGGDGSNSFNISTTVSFVVAAAGIPVAKHGNRSISSRCGSADLLEALGINIELTVEQIKRCIEEVKIGFLFAPYFHEATRYAALPRKELGVRTVFNLLGPLTNPCAAKVQVVGVYDKNLTRVVAEVLGLLGNKAAFVVYGEEGLDEISISGRTFVSYLKDGSVENFVFRPEEAGLKCYPKEAIKGGTPAENAAITLAILKGEEGAGKDIVLLNSAFALVAAGLAKNFGEGVYLAKEIIESGAALKKLEEYREFTRSFAA